jgi:23S rRNA (cytidine2498-2'-O)-methyltransferase
MSDSSLSRFIYVCTQHGAEKICKTQLAQQWPALRFSFSRPGFLTFKLTDDLALERDFDLKNIFVRCAGFTGPRLQWQDNEQELVKQLTELFVNFKGKHLHIWSRDLHLPGSREELAATEDASAAEEPADEETGAAAEGQSMYPPGTSPRLAELIRIVRQAARSIEGREFAVNRIAKQGEQVFDLILVDEDQVWSGWHQAASVASRWPGGIPQLPIPENMISRAYLKMVESLQWSRLPLKPGNVCAEIGAAPGGSCQALLDRGARVIGVDPAEVDPRIANHPNFRFVRGRGSEVKCREFRDVTWLFADTNVAPNHTLDTIERIVTHESVHVRGMILTLKLSQLELANDLPQIFERVKQWGFSYVRARQLAYNRREFCLAAFRNKAILRFGARTLDKSRKAAVRKSKLKQVAVEPDQTSAGPEAADSTDFV